MDEEFTVAIVMDNGRYHTKAGFAGDDAPKSVFPTIVARNHDPKRFVGMGHHPSEWVGDEAMDRGGSNALRNKFIDLQPCPITKGIIGEVGWESWNDMQTIWHHTFYNELRVAPDEHCVFLTESALNPKVNREKATQIMFEEFNVTGFYLCSQALSALYASGRTTGIVIHSGHDHTRVVPVYDGYAARHAITQLDIGGQQITEYLEKLLIENNKELLNKVPSETKQQKIRILNDIKEKMCLISNGNNNALRDITYELPDGQTIVLKKEERYQCTQPLFEPKLLDIEHEGIAHLIHETVSMIAKGDANIACDLTQHIILSGGNTMFTGLKERILKELTGPPTILVNGYLRTHGKEIGDDVTRLVTGYFNYKYNISAPMERKYSTWIGGSILSSLSTFEEMWIKPSEYDETGPTIVHRKCK
eukprot:242788_1